MLQGEHSAILLTFIKLPSVFKTFVLSISKWSIKTGFTVDSFCIHTNPSKGAIWPRGYKTFFKLNSTKHEILTAHKTKILINEEVSC